MLSVGKRAIDLHAIGEKLEFNDAREVTRGQRSEGVLTLGPGRDGPGAHIHTQQVEGFEVLSGTLVVVASGKSVTLRAGDSCLVAAGEAHTFRNGDKTTPVVAKVWYEPALNVEWMLQSLGELAMDRGGDWRKAPLLRSAYVMFLLRREQRLAGIPFWAQDMLLGTLAAVARITGQAAGVRRSLSDTDTAGNPALEPTARKPEAR